MLLILKATVSIYMLFSVILCTRAVVKHFNKKKIKNIPSLSKNSVGNNMGAIDDMLTSLEYETIINENLKHL